MTENSHRAEGKPPHLDRLSLLWRRLSDHKIVQWSVAYVALAYAIRHAIILTSESLLVIGRCRKTYRTRSPSWSRTSVMRSFAARQCGQS